MKLFSQVIWFLFVLSSYTRRFSKHVYSFFKLFPRIIAKAELYKFVYTIILSICFVMKILSQQVFLIEKALY